MNTKLNYLQIVLFALFYLIQVKVHADWSIDLSRRQVDFQKVENTRMPSSTVSVDPQKVAAPDNESSDIIAALKNVVSSVEPSKEIVIVQTEEGFVPQTINLQKDQSYKIHVVNLNAKEKNVSFLMDSFSQSHNTVYGHMRTFNISPKVEGVFSYQSPETGAAGTVVVVADKKTRKTASNDE